MSPVNGWAERVERGPFLTNTTPGRIRTGDLRFRKPPLYPTELRAQDS